ncbi:uncharacterized protein LOC100557981 isoform X2 [Anolis carolinensis]|uniref:uncharacterized protein LOC100557981 isoform X2 n=1 Tax=Anolis carolinensis TaxID=28377 RepID=UPI002F2B8348
MAPKNAPAAKKEAKKPDKDAKDDKAKDAKDDKAKDAKDDKAKDAKDDKAKDGKDVKESKFRQKIQQIKAFLHRPVAYLLACIFVFFIYIIAIIMLFLAFYEWNKTANLRRATEMVREFMIARNASYLEMSDVDILIEANKYAEILANSSKMLDEFDIDIEDARYRLNHDWVAHKHKMYVFRDRLVTIDQAKEMCKFEWAPMVKIESDEEEVSGIGNSLKITFARETAITGFPSGGRQVTSITGIQTERTCHQEPAIGWMAALHGEAIVRHVFM